MVLEDSANRLHLLGLTLWQTSFVPQTIYFPRLQGKWEWVDGGCLSQFGWNEFQMELKGFAWKGGSRCGIETASQHLDIVGGGGKAQTWVTWRNFDC